MIEENLSQELGLKNIVETKNYFLEEIEQNELMSRKHKTICIIISQQTFLGLQDVFKTNLNVYLTNLYFLNLYLTNLRQIQNALVRTQ